MIAREVWTLSEAARILAEPQHRLIYLCEKGVVVPDFAIAKGRGSSRRFSARNLLEFAVVLKLRELTLPVDTVAAIIHVLRAFETKVADEIKGFDLIHSLQGKNAPDLRIIISDGRLLYFSLGVGAGDRKLFGGLDFHSLATKKIKPTTIRKEKIAANEFGKEVIHKSASPASEFGGPEGSKHARIEISVTRIAKDLPLDG
jgi:DNA-binding transcriptional MerR regulator